VLAKGESVYAVVVRWVPAGAFGMALAEPIIKRHPSRTRVHAYMRMCVCARDVRAQPLTNVIQFTPEQC